MDLTAEDMKDLKTSIRIEAKIHLANSEIIVQELTVPARAAFTVADFIAPLSALTK